MGVRKKLVTVKRKRKLTVAQALLPLTRKERNFVEGVMAGKTPKEAKDEAGFRPGVSVPALMRRPEVSMAIEAVLRENSLGVDDLVKKLREAADANQVIVLNKFGDTMEAPDHNVRLKAVQTGLKLHGHLTTQKIDVTHREETYEERLRRLRGTVVEAEFQEVD